MQRTIVRSEHADVELDSLSLVVYELSVVFYVVFEPAHVVAHHDSLSTLAQQVVNLRLFYSLERVNFLLLS